MYGELVKNLRGRSQFLLPHYGEETSYDSDLMKQAADAIEFLQTYKVAFENIISLGGWWLVGQDKNLHRMDVPYYDDDGELVCACDECWVTKMREEGE